MQTGGVGGDFLTITVSWEHRAQVKFDMDSIVLPSIHWLDRIIFYKVFVPKFKAFHVFVLISFIMKSKLVVISQAPSVGEAAYFSWIHFGIRSLLFACYKPPGLLRVLQANQGLFQHWNVSSVKARTGLPGLCWALFSEREFPGHLMGRHLNNILRNKHFIC